MKVTIGIIAIVFAAATTAVAVAHSGATGIVKERMDLMKSIAQQMKLVSEMIKGERTFAAEAVVSAAQTIADHAEQIPDKFPDGSIEGMSEALPEIWDNWGGFIALNAEMKSSAEGLAEAATGADAAAIGTHFVTLGKTCLACHKDYRSAN